MAIATFRGSQPLSVGVELEVQLLAPEDYDLTPASPTLLDFLGRHPHAGHVTHEITRGMFEASTDVHSGLESLVKELRQMRDDIVSACDHLGLKVSGGGSHPYQRWPDQQVFDEVPRARALADYYGFLAKVNTVFGEHVHVGCKSGDDALYLLHTLSRYVPHFISLAAASPYNQGMDTLFDSWRPSVSLAFPLSGRAPCLLTWTDFTAYFERLRQLQIVDSMKDFYWDIRPKPEFGTVEVRVCDTPLTVERAAVLAAYIQALSAYLLEVRPCAPSEDDYVTYFHTRFSACRFGLDSIYVEPGASAAQPLRDHILRTLEIISPYADALRSSAMLDYLGAVVGPAGNDARCIREIHREVGSMEALMREQTRKWATDDPLLGR